MSSSTLERPAYPVELSDTPPSRKDIESRVEHVLSMPETDVAERLIGLVALSHDTEEIPRILVDAIDETADSVVAELDKNDYAVGEVRALVDAANVTGRVELAKKALHIVQDDIGYVRFDPQIREAVEISAQKGIELKDASELVRKLSGQKDIPMTIQERQKLNESDGIEGPIGAEYDWLFESDAPKPR